MIARGRSRGRTDGSRFRPYLRWELPGGPVTQFTSGFPEAGLVLHVVGGSERFRRDLRRSARTRHLAAVLRRAVPGEPEVLLAGPPRKLRPILLHIRASLDPSRFPWEGLCREERVLSLAHGRSLKLGHRTALMGILNVTPDSFYDGGRYSVPKRACERARELIQEGADILDVGGESTRPGAPVVSGETEWGRVEPVLRHLVNDTDVLVSVDTRRPRVARRALEIGAHMINDVGGLRDPRMVDLLRESRAAAVLMHMRGTPATMQKDTRYADLRGEVYSFLLRQSSRAQRRGLSEERIVLDPGLGFGKSYAANVELLWHLPEFLALGLPLLVGASRKGFLGALLGGVPPSERLEASLAAAVVAVLGGASLLRVHDVRATGRAVRLADALLIPGSPEDRHVLSGPEIRNRPSLPKGPSGPARRRR